MLSHKRRTTETDVVDSEGKISALNNQASKPVNSVHFGVSLVRRSRSTRVMRLIIKNTILAELNHITLRLVPLFQNPLDLILKTAIRSS